MITIEKGIPIPEKETFDLTESLKAMEIGDSFWMFGPQTSERCDSLAPQMTKLGILLHVLAREENGTLGIRVWRTK